MKRYRVGLAHLFSGSNELLLDGIRAALGGFGIGRIPPHITLTPPSNLYFRDVPGEIYRLRCLASETNPFHLEIGPAGTFSPVSPVLYLSVEGEGLAQVYSLQTKIASSSLYRKENRSFVPHVTLVDGEEESVVRQAVEILDSKIFDVEFGSFEMMLSPTHGFWEPTSDFRFEKCRKVNRGGMAIEVFSHRAGDISIYNSAAEQGVSPSLFWPHCDRRFRSDHQSNSVVSLYHQGELIAAGSAVYQSTNALIRMVMVAKESRGCGLGSLVLDELIYQLKLAGVERAFALVDDESKKFVQKCGAKPDTSGQVLFNYENGMTLNSWSFSRR